MSGELERLRVPMKAVSIGDCCAGNSTLLVKYTRGVYSPPSSTIGAALFTKQIVVGGVIVDLEIWDTAGQERFLSLLPMYFRGATLAIVGYDITDSDAFHHGMMDKWVQLARTNHIPSIALIGNKSDLEDRRAVSVEEAEAYALEKGLTYCGESSAMRGEGVAEVFEAAVRSAMLTDAWAESHTAAAALPREAAKTPDQQLCAAACKGSRAAAEELLQSGVNANTTDGDGTPVLSLAAKCGHTEVAALLLARGADALNKDRDGKTAAEVAGECGQPVRMDIFDFELSPSVIEAVPQALRLGGRKAGDAAAEALSRTLRTCSVLTELDLSNNGLTVLPAELCAVTSLCSLNLGGNDIQELPLELLQLKRLATLRLENNRRLAAVAQIGDQRGVPGIFDYIRDLHDDPKPSLTLKLMLIGSSMAGKTSIMRSLKKMEKRLADRDLERTIGLDIQRVLLRDPRRRLAKRIEFITYDAGGHEEYREMHSIFVTGDTLYVLVWNLALQPTRGQDLTAFTQEMIEHQAGWATLIQTCAPGSTVLLVGSHADEVADAAGIPHLLEAMAESVGKEMDTYRAAQQREFDQLSAIPVLSPAAAQRSQELRVALAKPLQLSRKGIAVSSKTLQGFDELILAMADKALDQASFPTFGASQPDIYTAILRKLRFSYPQQSSVAWAQMQEAAEHQSPFDCARLVVSFDGSTLSTARDDEDQEDQQVDDAEIVEPEPETAEGDDAVALIVGTLQHQADGKGDFAPRWVELSRAGILKIGPNTFDLTQPGIVIGEPKSKRKGHPFCVRIDCKNPPHKILLDTGNATEQQRWLESLKLPTSTQAAEAAACFRDYTFTVTLDDARLQQFTVRNRSAKQVHKQLEAEGLTGTVLFPKGHFGDAMRDFVHDEANCQRRGEGLRQYYQALLNSTDALWHAQFKDWMGFNALDLKERHSRVSVKVRKDPQLVRRAVIFLTIIGEVLSPRSDDVSLSERVFLRPQWLVDVMKVFVHHDLHTAIDNVTTEDSSDPVLVKDLGHRFCREGVLDRRLLPWLWRNLPFPLTQNGAEMEFVLELLTQLGLLTPLPQLQQDEPVLLLPIRLPTKDIKTTAAVAMAHAKFTGFLKRMGAADLLQGLEHVDVLPLTDALVYITGAHAVPQDAIDLAYQFADDLLSAGPDPFGLTRDDIAAIHLYTQENPIYGALNRALRSEHRDKVKPYWGYMKLLQLALFKLEKDDTGTLFRGIKVTWMPLATFRAQLQNLQDQNIPEIWWAFSSTSTQLSAVESFLGSSGPRVIFTIDGGSSARNVQRYSAIQSEAERLLPAGCAFTVKTIGSPAPDLLMVALQQTNNLLLQGPSNQPIAVATSPTQHQALVQMADVLSTTVVDEVGRRYDFHQPIPAGLVGVAISRISELCCPQTSVWRNAISTIMTEGELQLEVSMVQRTLSQIDITSRCAAGGHHDICLRKLVVFSRRFLSVVKERWPGCTWTEHCLSPLLSPHGVALSKCEQLVLRGEDCVSSMAASDGTVMLSALLGSEAVAAAALEPRVQAQVRTLHFFRALAAGLDRLGVGGVPEDFTQALDAALDCQLGGTHADGCSWSAALMVGGATAAVLGEDLAASEAVDAGLSRAIVLLGALGRLYERSHVLINSDTMPCCSMSDVCAYLLSPFPGLEATVRKLAMEQGLHDIPKLVEAFALPLGVAADGELEPPEGVPPGPELEPGLDGR